MTAAHRAIKQPILSVLLEFLQGTTERAKSKRGAAFAFGIRIVSAGILFLSHILLARWMGSFEFGIFAYVWVWVCILGPLTTFGFNTTVVRFFPQYREQKQLDLFRGLVLSSRAFVLIGSTLVSALAVGLIYLLGDALEDYYVIPLVLAVFCVPLFAITDLQDGMGRGQSWIDLALIPPYIARPVLLLVFMAIAALIGLPANAEIAICAPLAATIVTALGQYILVNRRFSAVIGRGPRDYRLGEWAKISLALMLLDSFALLLHNIDILMLKSFVAPNEIAVYFASARTISLIAFVHFAVSAVSWTKFSEYYSAGRHDDLQAFVRDTVAWTFWPSLFGAGILLALGLPLLWLFGPDFTAGYPVMFVLVVGLLARASVGPAEGVLNMLGHQNTSVCILAGTLVVNIALNLLLIPSFGLIGAAFATSAAYTFAAVFVFFAVKRKLGLHCFIIGGRNG